MTDTDKKPVETSTTTKEVKKAVKKPIVKRKPVKKVVVEMKKVDTGLILIEGQTPYLAMDFADDEIALSRIKGEMDKYKDVLVYCFQDSSGKIVSDLSIVGYDEFAYQLRKDKKLNISQEELSFSTDPLDKDYVIFQVKVKDLISGACSIGVKRQYTKLEKNIWENNRIVGKSTVLNSFYFEQGKSKAYRNGMKSLMPRGFIDQQVQLYIQAGKYANIGVKGQYKSIAGNSVSTVDLAKLKLAIDAVNKATTKVELDNCLKAVDNHKKDWNSQEQWKVKSIINEKLKKL